ncbi:MAG: hypothetical protein ACLQNE_39640 [Thermoguttaceae bacterium]|jgi:hypothetical protein
MSSWWAFRQSVDDWRNSVTKELGIEVDDVLGHVRLFFSSFAPLRLCGFAPLRKYPYRKI